MRRLPEARIAPGPMRDLTRHRAKLVSMRISCKNQVHPVLGNLGITVTHSDLSGKGGSTWLDVLRAIDRTG